jgi:hypothetical protein
VTILSTGLETMDYGTPGWNHIYNRNMDLLDNELLRLKALLDTDLSGIKDGESLRWSDSESKWVRL